MECGGEKRNLDSDWIASGTNECPSFVWKLSFFNRITKCIMLQSVCLYRPLDAKLKLEFISLKLVAKRRKLD